MGKFVAEDTRYLRFIVQHIKKSHIHHESPIGKAEGIWLVIFSNQNVQIVWDLWIFLF